MGLYFKTISTVLTIEAGRKSPEVFEQVFTFKEIKEVLKNCESKLTEKEVQELNFFRHLFWNESSNISGRPQFVFVNYDSRAIKVEVRLISKKEYTTIVREQLEANKAAWEEYSERRAQC